MGLLLHPALLIGFSISDW